MPPPSHNTFAPTADIATLRLRAQLLARVRSFFQERGFLEVETPILSADTVIDRHLDPFSTVLAPDARQPQVGDTLWLQTSPEFHMKRLLAAGSGSIFQISRVFRNGEVGRLHNPEFTMVEWYDVGARLSEGLALLADLAERLLARGRPRPITYADAFAQHVELDPHTASVEELKRAATRRQLSPPASLGDDRDAWLDFFLVTLVEPQLGRDAPQILYAYPASQAALARVEPGPPPTASRFELYVDGIELANGYDELLDPAELRRRNSLSNQQRQADGKSPLPSESRMLAAMESGLPPSCGCALGFDRLVMIAAGASDIRKTLAFPIERA